MDASRLNAVRGEVERPCVEVGVCAVVQAPEEGERAGNEQPDEVLEVEAAAEVGVGGEGGGGEEGEGSEGCGVSAQEEDDGDEKVAVEVVQHAAGGVVPPVQERGAERVGEEEGEEGVRRVVQRHEHPEAGLTQHARGARRHLHWVCGCWEIYCLT